jgi:hypothetical protein
MGGSDEDDPAHFRHGLIAKGLSEELAVFLRPRDVVDGLFPDGLPEARTASLDHHLRQDAAKAVTDDDHSVE